MRVTNHQYAAIRHRMRARALAQEGESQERAARRIGSLLGIADQENVERARWVVIDDEAPEAA